MAKVTIYDIALEAKLSPSSVSRILRGGKGHIYPEATQQRVREIAKRLGYRANSAARLLSQGSPTMIGVAVHFTEHPYLNRFLAAVHEQLLKHDYDPVFLDAHHLSSESERAPFPPPHMLAGFISPGLDMQGSWPHYYAEIRSHVPIVALQPVSRAASEWVDVVQVDFRDAYLQAGKHLLKQGHHNIAFLGETRDLTPSDACKHRGWEAAAKELGISTKHQIPWTVPISRPTGNGKDDYLYQPQSHRQMEPAVQRLTSFPQRITALVCSSDEVAIGFQSYLQSRGWKLPQNLSVVGYDGIGMGEYVYPSLTTIAPNYDKMAEAAVKRLLALIKGEATQTAQTQAVAPQLIIRDSTARLAE